MAPEGNCAVAAVLKVVGDRWTLRIIHELTAGPRRTLDLHASLKGLSTRTLTERLRKLERRGLINRKSYPETPPRVEYSLTSKGASVPPVIASLAALYGEICDDTSKGHTADCKVCAASIKTSSEGKERVEPPGEERNRPSVIRRRSTDVTLL